MTEYWNVERKCWVLFDPQIDNRQRELFKIGFDTTDVPRDQFVVAGDAWSLCRGGRTDPNDFGIFDMHGLWFIAGNLIRDVAALNNREMLPWDVWGSMPRQDSEVDLGLFDRLAIVSREPDTHVNELRALYHDERVSVPGTVFNAMLNFPRTVHHRVSSMLSSLAHARTSSREVCFYPIARHGESGSATSNLANG